VALEGLAHADRDQVPAMERIGRLLLVLSCIAVAGQGGPVAPVEVHPAVGAAMHMMEDDLALPWNLCGLARRVGLSRSHLVRRWRQATGMPPLAYLNRCRAERAAFLLAQTDRSIGDIAVAVGWPDPAHFSRRFRSIQGISASRYRYRFRHPVVGD
jgi:AraC family L-rhamnose operon transcriptional activator RhaR